MIALGWFCWEWRVEVDLIQVPKALGSSGRRGRPDLVHGTPRSHFGVEGSSYDLCKSQMLATLAVSRAWVKPLVPLFLSGQTFSGQNFSLIRSFLPLRTRI